MAWWDINRLFRYAFTDDPITKRDRKFQGGAGSGQPDSLDVKAQADGTTGGRGVLALRDSNEFVDLSTVTNRMHRYKEYDRLRAMPEIENAMTVFADEACLAGDTLVATPAYDGGFKTIQWLAENMANERFLCYAWDFEKEDYTLAWAFNPRLVKEEETIKILLDDGSHFIATRDHRILGKEQQWIEAGNLKRGDKLMPFYHLSARQELTGCQINQYPRIFSHQKGWMHERQFIDEWRTGKEKPELQRLNKLCRIFSKGISDTQAATMMDSNRVTNRALLKRNGFSLKEIKWLSKKADHRIVVGVIPWDKIKVYDLSVEKHENFCTNWGVAHNCQKDEKGRVFQINCKNKEIVEELEYLLFHRRKLNLDQKRVWSMAKNTFINGDHFYEICIDPENPKAGIANLVALPSDSMYRIETTKGRLVEFQQGKEGPDYQSLARVEVTQATDADLAQATAIRFAPEQIVHTRIGDDRKTFYPYGVSLVEPARGPAHQLRMMEDAMVVYRLSRAPERRVFYIDVAGLPSNKAEAFMERMKDQFKKKKIAKNFTLEGASSVEERWHPPAQDEDYWIPIRPNTQTRVETLPGAQNLGEIDDTVYFRNKLFIALNFPKNYFNNDDASTTRISLSSLDIKFARMIERLQSHIEDSFYEICERHLRLRGYPEEEWEDLTVTMTPPSDWREMTRQEVISTRIQNAGSLKGAALMSDFDILNKWMKYSEDEVKLMLARLDLQKLKELKFQIVAQNPQLLGVGLPGPDEEQVGTEPGEQSPMLGGMPGQETSPEQGAPPPPTEGMQPPEQGSPQPNITLPNPSDEDLRKYDLEIRDFGSEMDEPEVDDSEL